MTKKTTKATTKKKAGSPARSGADPELARLLELAESDPRAALGAADRLHHEVEVAAIREALRRSHGLVKRAAGIIGWTDDRLAAALTRGRHRALMDEVDELRRAAGYHGGNPDWTPSEDTK